MVIYVPGMRVEIRDEQWIVRKVEKNSHSIKLGKGSIPGSTLYVQGLSKLVKDIEAIFLDTLDEIKVIKPEETKLIYDESNNFMKSRLYIESKLRKKIPTDGKLYVGHKAAMDLMEYQIEPTIKALKNTRQRILIADAVGLGKTLEAGILMSELIARRKGKRILVVTVKSMMTQFQKEMWSRFSIPLKRLDSNEIQKVRREIPSNHNPFDYYDKTIVSVDTIKRDIEYRNYLENSRWDIIVIDEAHNVAKRGNSEAQRAKLAELLSKRSETLIMLSATPHDGKAKSFASLMNMLDPTAIANEDDYTKEDIEGLYIRRFKKDIQDQILKSFKERKLLKEVCYATAEEEDAFGYFTDMKFKSVDKNRGTTGLFKTVLEKAMFSSPQACIDSVKKRIQKLEKEDSAECIYDRNILNEFKNKLERITAEKFSRYKQLILILKAPSYGWDKKASNDRIVIFTERIETMRFLKEQLMNDLKLKDNEVQEFYGGMSDVEQQEIVDAFGNENSKIKILVASDVASEGINLHYMSHRMIHFDIPWSLMVFQQRNGRIDRYGQEETPDIRYLVTEAENEKIKGDMRFLEILVEKEEQAEKNIGDPAGVLNLYDIEAEEKTIAEAIETGLDPDKLFGNFEDLLNTLENDNQSDDGIKKERIDIKEYLSKTPTLYDDDLSFLKAGLTNFHKKHEVKSNSLLEVELDEYDLKWSLKNSIPKECMKNKTVLKLSPKIDTISESIKNSRKSGNDSWPEIHYLWKQHPIFEWLNDKNETIFGRQEAPIIPLESLGENEVIFIIGGVIPNKKSIPLIDEWYGIKFIDNQEIEILDIEKIIELLHIEKKLQNIRPISEERAKIMEKIMPIAIKKVEDLMEKEWQNFEEKINPKLQFEMDRLEALKEKHKQVMKNKNVKDKQERKIDKIFNEFLEWIEDSMTLEKENPYIHIVGAITGV